MGKLNPRLMAMRGGGMALPGMVAANQPGGKRPPASRIIFNKYSKDNEGNEIAAEEFKFMCMDLGHQLSEEEEKFAILKIDHSGSGKINYDDFLEWWKTDEKWESLRLEDDDLLQLSMLLTEFQAFDADDDGTVDHDEFGAMYDSLKAGGVEKPLETVLAELDENGDGKVVFNEYVSWLNRNVDARKALGCAAHAAATARANNMVGFGVEEGAAPSEVCPDKVVVVEEKEEAK